MELVPRPRKIVVGARARTPPAVPRGDEEWTRGWVGLQRFVEVRGTAYAPLRAVAAGVAVGEWVAARRTDYWTGKLDPVQTAALEGLPGWTWAGRAQRAWEARFAALRRYSDQHSSAMAPAGAMMGNLPIGVWAREQRISHAAGRLPAALVERLQGLPGWVWTLDEDRWERGLPTAWAYVAEHGNADVPVDAVLDGFRLGLWVRRCRQDYTAGDLSPEQIDALQALPGWRWPAAAQQWENGIAALRAFHLEHDHANPPQHVTVNGIRLGEWVHNRRQQYRRGQLTAVQIGELEDVPGWAWTLRGTDWERGFAALQRWVEQHHLASPPLSATIDGFMVGEWVRIQRAQFHRGRLPPRRIEQLLTMPGWLWRSPR